MTFLTTLLAFLVALAILIVIHELGHFCVARMCGVKVLRFSVGFGNPIFTLRMGADRTEWTIAAWPLGGYVKMLDEREGPVDPNELPRAFNQQTVWRRIAIVLAGPLANLALAVVIYWCILIVGVVENKPTIAPPEPNSIAAMSGLQGGETVTRVNGFSVVSWQDLRWQLMRHVMDRGVVKLETLNQRNELNWLELDFSNFNERDLEGDLLAKSGLRIYRPRVEAVIGSVAKGSVAERAGIKVGDRVLTAAGVRLETWEQLVAIIRTQGGTALALGLGTTSGERIVTLVPELVTQGQLSFGRIGVSALMDVESLKRLTVTVRYGPFEAIPRAIARTWDTALFSLKMFGKMLLGEVSWRHLSGPVTIADYAGQSAQLGVMAYIGFLALISISLGVLNLLPIPLLDGGHLMYYVVELIKGSPVSDRIVGFGQKLGLSLLILLTAFAFYNDINRLISG